LRTNSVLIDDRLLVDHLTSSSVLGPRSKASLHTTTYWYYRACRAASFGGGGQLSGPFASLSVDRQSQAIQSLLLLSDEIGLPDPRPLAPAMVDITSRHPRLNVMNVEAIAAAYLLGARVLLSPAAADGIIAPVLDAESIRWDVHAARG
jgi:hypothetical protein